MGGNVLDDSNITRYLYECRAELVDKSRNQFTYSRHVDEITRKNYWHDMYGICKDYSEIIRDCITIFIEFERVIDEKFKRHKFDVALVFYLKQKRALSSCIKSFSLRDEIAPFIENMRVPPPEIYVYANKKSRCRYAFSGKEYYARSFVVENEFISNEKYNCIYSCERSDEDRDSGFGFSRDVSIISYADAR